jgi:hypothetical protein
MFTFGILQVVSMCNLYNPYQYIYVQRFYLAGLGRGDPLPEGGNVYEGPGVGSGGDMHEEGQEAMDMEPPDVVVADYIQNTFGVEPRALDPVTAAKDHEGMTNLQREAGTPIYKGSNVNRLAIVMELLKVQARNPTMTNQCVDDVLRLINNFIIDPKLDNKMPKTRYEARKVVSDMGLDYVSIHACPCDGMLYYGPYAQLAECPLEGCGLSRYRVGMLSKKVPRKVCVLPYLNLRKVFSTPCGHVTLLTVEISNMNVD